ncbi:MAG: hypothetical protein LBP92_06555 [Deltaproteobacteria bacterium]|nr:hypothetical protein [Deltaproteobacteria bacterium]
MGQTLHHGLEIDRVRPSTVPVMARDNPDMTPETVLAAFRDKRPPWPANMVRTVPAGQNRQ